MNNFVNKYFTCNKVVCQILFGIGSNYIKPCTESADNTPYRGTGSLVWLGHKRFEYRVISDNADRFFDCICPTRRLLTPSTDMPTVLYFFRWKLLTLCPLVYPHWWGLCFWKQTLLNFNIYSVIFSSCVWGLGQKSKNQISQNLDPYNQNYLHQYTKQENVFSGYSLSKKLQLRTVTLITLMRWLCKTYIFFPWQGPPHINKVKQYELCCPFRSACLSSHENKESFSRQNKKISEWRYFSSDYDFFFPQTAECSWMCVCVDEASVDFGVSGVCLLWRWILTLRISQQIQMLYRQCFPF